MKNLNFTMELLQEPHGITCVESQFIAILKYYNMPYQAAFVESFIDICEGITVFMENKLKYAYFNEIKRIQNMAEILGIGKITKLHADFDEMLIILQKNLSRGFPLLVHVDACKLPQSAAGVPWRDDHYISLYGMTEAEIYALDNVPVRELKMSYDSLLEAYRPDIFVFDSMEGLDKDKYVYAAEAQIEKMLAAVQRAAVADIDSLIPKDMDELVFFRDALGILRISRQRMKAWLEWLALQYDCKTEPEIESKLEDTIIALDNLYSVIELYRLRGKLNQAALRKFVGDIINCDREWLSCLKSIGYTAQKD